MSERKYIQHYHSTTSGSVPAAEDLLVGEIAINVADAAVYTKDHNDDIICLNDSQIFPITYQELRMLRNNDKLRVGAKYMITDYDAVTDPDLLNVSYEANTTQNILVTAITSNEIDKIAWLINKSTGKLIKNFVIHYSIDPVATPYGWFTPDQINHMPSRPELDIISLTANSETLFQTNVEVVIDNTTYYLWDSVSDTKYLSVLKNPVEANDTLLHIYDADTDTITGTCNWTAHELLRAFGPTYEYSGTNRRYLFVPYNVQVGDTCFELNLSDGNNYTFGIYNDAVEITSIHEQKGCITYMKYLPSNTSCNYDFLRILMKCSKSSYPDVFRHTFTSVNTSVDDYNNYIGNTNIINEGYYNFISNSSDVKIQGDYNVLRGVESTEIIYSNGNDISGTHLTVYQSNSNSISGYNNILYYATNCSTSANAGEIVIRQSQSCEITGASTNNELIRCSSCSLTTSNDNTLICSNNINLVWGDDNVFDHSSQITVSCKSVDRNIFRNSHNISFDSEGVYANSTDNIFIDSNNIKIGMYCTNNVFNAGCNNITLAKYNCYNTFGNNCDTILFCATPPNVTTESNRPYVQHLTFDNNVKNCVIYDAVGESMDATEIIQNYHIKNASDALVNIWTLNQDYVLVVNKNSSGEVKIYNEADLIA